MVASVLMLLLWLGGGESSKPTAKEALQPFHDLIGSWRGTGIPEGSKKEKQTGSWVETQKWAWRFNGDDVCLVLTIEKGKHFTKGELRPGAERGNYKLLLHTTDQREQRFVGTLTDRVLTLSRTDETTKEVQRLVIRLIHNNRHLLDYEVKPDGKPTFSKRYQIGATKEGVAFAAGDGKPECIVSGGLGTITVTHKGQTYYVCCSGCRDEFKADPEKYIKEHEAKKRR